MKKIFVSGILTLLMLVAYLPAYCWGFWAHQKINYFAVFSLPPEMMVLFKPNITFISEHAVDPDKRRYAVAGEGPRHYIDIDHWGEYPYDSLPRKWKDAVAKYSLDSITTYGIVPWHVQVMLGRLTDAFRDKNFSGILKTAPNWATILPMHMFLYMPIPTTTGNIPTKKAYTPFGKAGFRNYWPKSILTFLWARPNT